MSPPTLPVHATLIVIDMLNDFFDQQPVLAAARTRLVASINDLSRGFRTRGLPVVWVRQEFKADLSDAFLDMRRLDIRVTIEGTRGAEILSDLERSEDDAVVVKKRYSAFYNTSLEEILVRQGSTLLVLAGINTHACIRTAAVDAYQRDYDVILAVDCTASYDPAWHDETLRYIDGRIARAMPSAAILDLLAP